MRSNLLARTLVGVTAVVALSVGSLATAGTSFAASQPAARSAVSAQTAGILSNNLGLSTERAKNWQCRLRDNGYDPGPINGILGTESWRAAQTMFNDLGLRTGPADGDPTTNTIAPLQRYLNLFGYGLVVDGNAGPLTKVAFSDFNSTGC
ncbi:peptidoglycan-binding protein [Streptomyces sp. MBT65]|uniref:peptidoglycan-binding domain-containing protein n=1 Tax=Streptomyces sp. MBT65 TaxID=1488395 RepID=UPI00190C0038|nr:peptidoglycan-binding protein [Streptomyces sp. MBT65]MBK3577378.1 peptidoglycan-binding protein [Streptomyces sp. MBT65]